MIKIHSFQAHSVLLPQIALALAQLAFTANRTATPFRTLPSKATLFDLEIKDATVAPKTSGTRFFATIYIHLPSVRCSMPAFVFLPPMSHTVQCKQRNNNSWFGLQRKTTNDPVQPVNDPSVIERGSFLMVAKEDCLASGASDFLRIISPKPTTLSSGLASSASDKS